MRHWRMAVIAGSLAIFLASVANLAARQVRPKPQIRVRTWVVSLNVVVTDKSRNPVAGLTKNDFTLLDNGKAQTIEFFSAVPNQAPPAPQPLPPDTYTNDVSKLGDPPSVTVVLFDALNTNSEVRAYAIQEVRAFLRHIQPEDHVALYVLRDAQPNVQGEEDGLGINLEVIHDFTENAADLVAAIRRYDAKKTESLQAAAPAGTAENPVLDRFLEGKENGIPNPPELAPKGQVLRGGFHPHVGLATAGTGINPAMMQDVAEAYFRTTTQAFQAIRRHLDGVPGRKALVYVTQSLHGPFPVDPLHLIPLAYTANYAFIQRQFNNAGIAVYPVSAGGVESPSVGYIDNPDPGFGEVTELPEVPMHLAMRRLAERTGGRALIMRNDLDTGIEQALDDARLTYSIGYYPDNVQSNGEFHRIEIRVHRKDVKVLSRDGYNTPTSRNRNSMAPASALSSQPPTLRQIRENPLDATMIPLTVTIKPSSGSAPPALWAEVDYDPREMVSLKDDGIWRGQIEIALEQLDARDNLLNTTSGLVALEYPQARYDEAAKNGMKFEAHVTIRPGASALVAIMRDVHSGAVGSVHIPLQKYLPATNH